MNNYKNWIEPTKTVILTVLILLSFGLTGYLLYSAPSFEESREGSLRPPYIGDKKYNQQNVFELASPFQMITHQQGKHTYSFPKENEFNHLYNTVREAELTNFAQIHPTPQQWKFIFLESQSVELKFLQDTSVGQLDAFFKNTTLREQPEIQEQQKISRIFLYVDPTTQYVWTWFISDADQTVIQAQTTGIDVQKLRKGIRTNTAKQKILLIPRPTNNKAPWDEENQKVPFSPILYVPSQPLPIERYTYHLHKIDIEHMKQWLFKDPSVAPVQLNQNELLYMYNDPNMYNNQIITYNKQENTMVYTNAPPASDQQSMLIREEINEINQFIQRHQGWTNFYLLEQIRNEDHANEYTFRLMINHLPVYGTESDRKMRPDMMEFQVKNTSISKYARSMYFLPKKPSEKEFVDLPDMNDLYALLKQRKISISQIKQLYPGYQIQQMKNNQVTLQPVWVIETIDGKKHFLSSPSPKED